MKTGYLTQKNGFIFEVFCEKQYRGKGYGKTLMLLLEEKAREMALESLVLHVFKSNTAARRLYESIGYKTAGENTCETLLS